MASADRFQVLRPLGGDRTTVVALDTSAPGSGRLVVLDRLHGSTLGDAGRADLSRRAAALAKLTHPKLVRVREMVEDGGDLLVVSDFVDGEWLETLVSTPPDDAQRAPFPVLMRVILDVLEGLTVLHELTDEKDAPLPVVYGTLSPAAVIVTERGATQVAGALRPRRASRAWYVAPEVAREGAKIDARADVYAAGAMLWEMLSGERLHAREEGAAHVPPPRVPAEAPWAEPLAEVVWRAMSVDPEERFPTAWAMASEVRRITGARAALPSKVTAYVRETFGPRIRARRAALDLLDEAPPSSSQLVDASELEIVPDSVPPPPAAELSKKPPPPPPHGPAAAPIPLVTKRGEAAAREVIAKPVVIVATHDRLTPEPSTIRRPEIALPPAAAAVEEPDAEAVSRGMPTIPVDRPPGGFNARVLLVPAMLAATLGIGWWIGRHTEARETPTATAAGAVTCPPAPVCPTVAVPSPPPPPAIAPAPSPSPTLALATPPAPVPGPAPAPPPAPAPKPARPTTAIAAAPPPARPPAPRPPPPPAKKPPHYEPTEL